MINEKNEELLSHLLGMPEQIIDRLSRIDTTYESDKIDDFNDLLTETQINSIKLLIKESRYTVNDDIYLEGCINTTNLKNDMNKLIDEKVQELLKKSDFFDNWSNIYINDMNILYYIGNDIKYSEIYKKIVLNNKDKLKSYVDKNRQTIAFYNTTLIDKELFSFLLLSGINFNHRDILEETMLDRVLKLKLSSHYMQILDSERFNINEVKVFFTRNHSYSIKSAFHSLIANIDNMNLNADTKKEMLQKLIGNKKFDINGSTYSSYLYQCLYEKKFNIATNLILAGADIQNINNAGSNVLYFMYQDKVFFEKIKPILETKKDKLINYVNFARVSAFPLNIRDDNYKVVEWMIQNGEKYDFMESLSLALSNNSVYSSEVLIKNENNISVYFDKIIELIQKNQKENKRLRVDYSELISYLEKRFINENGKDIQINKMVVKNRI